MTPNDQQAEQKSCGSCNFFKRQTTFGEDEEYGDCQFPINIYATMMEAIKFTMPRSISGHYDNYITERMGYEIEYMDQDDGSDCPTYQRKETE